MARHRRRQRRGAAVVRRRRWSGAGYDPGGVRTLRDWQRDLREDVAPTGRRADVGIAEPDVFVEGLAVVRAFAPEERGDDRGIAPDANRPVRVLLVLVR